MTTSDDPEELGRSDGSHASKPSLFQVREQRCAQTFLFHTSRTRTKTVLVHLTVTAPVQMQ